MSSAETSGGTRASINSRVARCCGQQLYGATNFAVPVADSELTLDCTVSLGRVGELVTDGKDGGIYALQNPIKALFSFSSSSWGPIWLLCPIQPGSLWSQLYSQRALLRHSQVSD